MSCSGPRSAKNVRDGVRVRVARDVPVEQNRNQAWKLLRQASLSTAKRKSPLSRSRSPKISAFAACIGPAHCGLCANANIASVSATLSSRVNCSKETTFCAPGSSDIALT